MSLQDFSLQILSAIDSGTISTKAQLNDAKIFLCKAFGMHNMPTNADILSFSKPPSEKALRVLRVKPTKTLSGIAAVAVMTRPMPCPGKCIYCPGGTNTPKSYTGKEPAAMRALTFKFDPFKQVWNRLRQLEATGHSTDKIELIVMGGTFASMPVAYQKRFVKGCIEAAIGQRCKGLADAQKRAERTAGRRIIGITFETRPDWCAKKDISRMLSLGGTRAELGVQALSNGIYKKIDRGHTVEDVSRATALLKDSAFKVAYHLMPGLPGATPESDIETFRTAFSEQSFMPDMLKIYPCLVVRGTRLYSLWKRGLYKPYTTDEAAEIIAKAKEFVPKWARVMRIQRDIPLPEISAGVSNSNLREIVKEKMQQRGTRCRCIRCREAGLAAHTAGNTSSISGLRRVEIFKERYEASKGTELFISAEDPKQDVLYGFCRLRIPAKPFRREITSSSALVRELHVYGRSLPLHSRSAESAQHASLGKALLAEAERISKDEFNARKILVISGIGAREYYRMLSYRLSSAYMAKTI